MKFAILTRRLDNSIHKFFSLFEINGITTKKYNLEDTSISKLHSILDESDLIWLRDPYYAAEDIQRFLPYMDLLKNYPEKLLFNKKSLFSPTLYSDKYIQFEVFQKLKLPIPKTFCALEEIPEDSKGIVVKERLNSRNKGNAILGSPREVDEYVQQEGQSKYIFQEKIYYKHDLRIMYVEGKYIGTVERKLVPSPHNPEKRLLKVSNTFDLQKYPQIIRDCQALISQLELSMPGIDVLIKPDDTHVFLEYNVSAQFTAFCKVTGDKLLESIRKCIQNKTNS